MTNKEDVNSMTVTEHIVPELVFVSADTETERELNHCVRDIELTLRKYGACFYVGLDGELMISIHSEMLDRVLFRELRL